MTIRTAFTDRFGEDQAAAIVAAAEQHHPDDNRGSDPFKWALLIAIGFECMTRFAANHGITADPDELQAWVREHADLGSHDGDCDYLSLLCGSYEEWMPVVTS